MRERGGRSYGDGGGGAAMRAAIAPAKLQRRAKSGSLFPRAGHGRGHPGIGRAGRGRCGVTGPGVGRAARRFCGPGRVKSAPKARATRSGVGGGIPVTAVKGLNLPQVSLSWWNKHLI